VSKFCISRIFPSFKSSTLKKYRARCSLVFPHTPTRNHVLTQGLKVQVKKKGRLKTNRRSSGTHQTAHATEGRDRPERNLLRLVSHTCRRRPLSVTYGRHLVLPSRRRFGLAASGGRTGFSGHARGPAVETRSGERPERRARGQRHGPASERGGSLDGGRTSILVG
jgi:hypothetical protein